MFIAEKQKTKPNDCWIKYRRFVFQFHDGIQASVISRYSFNALCFNNHYIQVHISFKELSGLHWMTAQVLATLMLHKTVAANASLSPLLYRSPPSFNSDSTWHRARNPSPRQPILHLLLHPTTKRDLDATLSRAVMRVATSQQPLISSHRKR